MDRRVLGSGAIVCSAMVLWAQPSPPESSINECEDEQTATATCSNSQTQEHQTPRVTPTNNNIPEFLQFNLQWSGIRSNRLPDNMEAIYDNLLKQAQAAASGDRLTTALTHISGIPKNSRHYEIARQLQEDWSQQLLQHALNRCQQGDITMAISMLNAIPPTSDRFARATELRDNWHQQAELIAQASTAKNTGDWQSVIAALESLQGTPLYHSLPVQELLQQAISHRFQPDTALLQLATATPSSQPAAPSAPAAAEAVPSLPATAPTQAPVSVDPLLDAPTLEIDLAQAIEWAQPPAPTAIPRPTQLSGSMVAASSPNRAEPPTMQPSIARPEPSTQTSKLSHPLPKISQPGDLATLPELNSLPPTGPQQ